MAEVRKLDEYEKTAVEVPTKKGDSKKEVPVVFPQKRLKKVTRLEKIAMGMLLLIFIGLAFTTIYLSTAIAKESEQISTMQQGISTDNDKIIELEQEKSELSRKDRIKAIAEKSGLKLIEENIKKVSETK